MQAASKKEAGGDVKHVFFFTSPKEKSATTPIECESVTVSPLTPKNL